MKQVTLSKTTNLNLLISKNNALDFYNTNLTFTLITSSESNSKEDMEAAQQDQNISYCKILSFIENILNNSIVAEITDPYIEYFAEIENNLITVADISDVALVAAFHSKFNALACANTDVETVSLYDTQEKITFEYTSDPLEDEYTDLPSNELWCPEFSYWDMPWWKRNDIGTYDAVHGSEESYLKWLESDELQQLNAITENLFKEINEQFIQGIAKPGELIEVDFSSQQKGWKPTFVD